MVEVNEVDKPRNKAGTLHVIIMSLTFLVVEEKTMSIRLFLIDDHRYRLFSSKQEELNVNH